MGATKGALVPPLTSLNNWSVTRVAQGGRARGERGTREQCGSNGSGLPTYRGVAQGGRARGEGGGTREQCGSNTYPFWPPLKS